MIVMLDLFCGAGDAAMGYHRAFEAAGIAHRIIGVDVVRQLRYPFEFVLADAMTFPLDGFDAIHASPPCQGESIMRNLPWLRDREYPMLVRPTRKRLQESGVPWVLENVYHARRSRKKPDGMEGGWLCGLMFDLPIFRHRIFESSFYWMQPGHPKHRGIISASRFIGDRARVPVLPRKTGQTYGFDRPGAAVGHGNMGGLSARDALGVPWMTRDEATQAMPPVYLEYIGRALLASMEAR